MGLKCGKEKKRLILSQKEKTKYSFQIPYGQYYLSLPNPIIYYIIQKPQSSKFWKKLIQTAKYFFSHQPILPANTITICCEQIAVHTPSDQTIYVNANDLKKVTFWIQKGISSSWRPIYRNSPNSLSVFVPRIYRCDAETLKLHYQNLTWKEFQTLTLSENLKVYEQHDCNIYGPNDSTFTVLATLDEIIDCLQYLEELEITFLDNNFPLLMKNAIDAFGKQLLLRKNLKKVGIFNAPEPFDVRDLYNLFMNVPKSFKFKIYYCDNIGEAFKEGLNTFIENIIQQPPKVIPLIKYVGQNEMALKELDYLSQYWPEATAEQKNKFCCDWKCFIPFI